MIDTYWSDHCRHTTFNTIIDHASFEDPLLEKAYEDYLATRRELGRTKPVCLMDLATVAVKYLKNAGKLPKLDESEEINACTVKITVEADGKPEPWLLLFKNETHNHPTEIEPFGGAATCIGGAIRDPCPAAAMCTEPCVLPAQRTLWSRQRDHLRQVAPAEAGDHGSRPDIPPTVIRSAWPRALWMRFIIPATPPSAWRSAQLSARRLPAMSAARSPPRVMSSFCWADARAATVSAVPPVPPRRIS